MRHIVPAPTSALVELGERVAHYQAAAQAENTRAAYARAWRGFEAWCREHDVAALPASPVAVAAWITERADDGAAVATLAQALSAIGDKHTSERLPSPVRDPDLLRTWSGIRRKKARPPRKARPLSPKEIRAMIRALRPGLKAIRDRALMLVGFAGAMRREELVGIHVEHIGRTDDERLIVTIPRSKGDQEAKGQRVVIPRGSDRTTCPVVAVQDWLTVSRIAIGPIFRGIQRGALTEKQLLPGDVSRILKSAAKRAGVPVTFTSGHSLRRGLATTARREGRSLDAIQRQTRHANIQTTIGYLDEVELERAENAAEGIGL